MPYPKRDYHPELEDDFDAEAYQMGQRAALDGMDLPDGAYLAMEEEMGLDPYDVDFDEDEGEGEQ